MWKSHYSSARFMHLQSSMLLSDSSRSKSTDGIRRSQRRSLTFKRTRSIWTLAVQWCSMLWLKSRMKWIRLWLSVDLVAREFADRAPWPSVAQTLWHVLAKSILLISTSPWRSIHCRICMSSKILCPTWIIFTTSIGRFNHGCSESKIFW